MNAEVHDLKACEVSLDEAKAELARLLADSRFRVTERQKDILRYLAEHRFEGCEEGVKAYSIALDVLGRPSGFDASTDPIVRIEISRLRSALDAYYQAFGLPNGVTIHIPKGMYTAIFPAVLLPQDPDEEIPDHHGEAANVPPPRSSALPAKLLRRLLRVCAGRLPELRRRRLFSVLVVWRAANCCSTGRD